MATAPRNRNRSALSAFKTRVVAFVGLASGVARTLTDEDRSPFYEVLSLSLSAGGSKPDTVTLRTRLDRTGRMQRFKISDFKNHPVEIWTLDAKGRKDRPLFRGEGGTRTQTIAAGESETVTASLYEAMFGQPVDGMRVFDQVLGYTTLHHDLEFQPLIDGKVVWNRCPPLQHAEWPDENVSLFILPEQQRTPAALEQYDGDIGTQPQEWTLAEAVKYLQWHCNPDDSESQRVKNYEPSSDDLTATAYIKNVTLRREQYLPALLDQLLPPYGFNWCVVYEVEEPEEAPAQGEGDGKRISPKIKIFKRGEGTQRKLKVPRLGDVANLDNDAVGINITTDIWSLANVVRAYGWFAEREVTIDLHRAWPEAQDSATMGQMDKRLDSDAAPYAYGSAWRKWVANEAGDYTGSREGAGVDDIQDVPEFTSDFPDLPAVRRRRLSPPLLWQDDEETRRRPVFVEWSDDGGTTWKPAAWNFRTLDDEIGIVFTDVLPPAELVDAGDDARVRVTGTIESDTRLMKVGAHDGSLNSTHVNMAIDAGDQFFDRAASSGVHAPETDGDRDTADDGDALQQQADDTLTARNALGVTLAVGLFGLRFEYQIGDVITAIDGRLINLNRVVDGERYLQVMGIDYDFTKNTTRLHVAPYDV